MSSGSFPGEWLRGTLDMCVLSILADGPSYGYVIGQRLKAAGLGTVMGGTLYPLLARLESAELVTTAWHSGESGPARKYLQLTDAGCAALDVQRGQWYQFTSSVGRLVLPEAR